MGRERGTSKDKSRKEPGNCRPPSGSIYFYGVGNIIKNEVLFLAKTLPTHKIKELSPTLLKKIASITRKFVFQFYEWRKKFVLRKHYQIYRQGVCKVCGSKVVRKKTGTRNRISYFCPKCQK